MLNRTHRRVSRVRSHNNTEADCQASGFGFIPFVIEAVGGVLGPAATDFLSQLAKIKNITRGEHQNNTLSHFYMNLGVILHRENARAILRRRVAFAPNLPSLAAAAEVQSTS